MPDYKTTLTNLNEILTQNPNDIKALANRGETYRLMGDYQPALAYFTQVIEMNPYYAWAIAHRGETYYLSEQYELAFADFDRAIQLKLDYAWAYAHRGACCHKLNRYEEAIFDLNQAIQLKPDYTWAIGYRGQMYALMNHYEKALTDFDRALALDKNFIPYWPGERALLLSYLGRYAEAIDCCEQGLKDHPDDYVTQYTLTVIKTHQLGKSSVDIDKARSSALKILNNLKEHAGALYRLGGLAALEGHREQALDYLEKAISLANEPRELARRDLAWLNLRDDTQFQTIIDLKS